MPPEQNNPRDFIQRPLGFVAGGMAEFDNQDAALLGIPSPQPVDAVVDAALRQLEVIDDKLKSMPPPDIRRGSAEGIQEAYNDQVRNLGRLSLHEQRLKYIITTAGAVALSDWRRSGLSD